MEAWLLVLGLIILGIILIVAEVIFIPGTTFVGVLGFLFSVIGVYQSFSKFGNTTGWYVLGVTGIALLVAVVLSFRTNAWEKLALNKNHESRVSQNFPEGLNVGETGISISSLRPIGKGVFKETEVEVSTLGEYIDSNVNIEIIKIESNKIFVKPIITS